MNKEKAYIIMQISDDIAVSNEFLKKRYRLIATKIHPDKFIDQRKKYIATKKFIELKEAYEYLLLLQKSNLNNIKFETEESNEEFENKENIENEEMEYIVYEDTWYDFILYLLFIPGIMILYMITFVPIALSIMINSEADELDTKTKKIFHIIISYAYILFSFGLFGWLVFSKVINGIKNRDIFWMYIVFSVIGVALYQIVNYIRILIIKKTKLPKIN